MNINIKRQKIDLEKLKYELIFYKHNNYHIGYDWKLNFEDTDETLEDLHLFCISIVKDLFEKNFKTNEKGKIIYEMEDIDNEEIESILNYLKSLFSKLINNKLKND